VIVDVRIGVTYTAKEIELELEDGADRGRLVKDVEAALSDEEKVLWVTDKRGRQVGVPSSKIAYVEIGSPNDDRRVGFGAH
jgi:hypothetical protein